MAGAGKNAKFWVPTLLDPHPSDPHPSGTIIWPSILGLPFSPSFFSGLFVVAAAVASGKPTIVGFDLPKIVYCFSCCFLLLLILFVEFSELLLLLWLISWVFVSCVVVGWCSLCCCSCNLQFASVCAAFVVCAFCCCCCWLCAAFATFFLVAVSRKTHPCQKCLSCFCCFLCCFFFSTCFAAA